MNLAPPISVAALFAAFAPRPTMAISGIMQAVPRWIGVRIVFTLTTAIAIAVFPATANAEWVDSVRIMTFNIFGGGMGTVEELADVIRAADADVIAFQEVNALQDNIAAELGSGYYHNRYTGQGIVSRFPITQSINGGVGGGPLAGWKLELSPGQEIYVFNAHLAAYPYQPYGIRDGLLTNEAQAIAEAQATRGAQLNIFEAGMAGPLASELPVFMVGDFNEPSHLDWTQEAADAGLNFDMKVDWPTSKRVSSWGLVDSFRALRPDEINDRGETWTPGYAGMPPDEVHDRIDFVYYTPDNVLATNSQVVGPDVESDTDILFPDFPSDHRAVVTEFMLIPAGLDGDYNGDGMVDAADYTVWRNNLDAPDETAISHNGDGGGIDASDYDWWKLHYGDSTLGAAAIAPDAVPEPANAWLVLLSATVLATRRGLKKLPCQYPISAGGSLSR